MDTPMSLVYSAEQERIYEMTSGPVIVVANAGTGKTTTTAELMVRRYLDEEHALYPNLAGHVADADQRRILRQFLCLTFTRKAAAVYDAEIKGRLAERGVPIPVKANGDDYRIARTLDSYVRSWLRHPLVFKAWMEVDPDTHARLRAILNLPTLRADTQGQPAPLPFAEATGAELQACHRFSGRWPWMAGEDVGEMLLDLILRHYAEQPLPDCDVIKWGEDFDQMLAGLELAATDAIDPDFWRGPLQIWHRHQERLRQMDHALKQGKALEPTDQAKGPGEVLAWERLNQKREEFIAVQELGRARGYHPIYAPEKLACGMVEEQLAACDHLKGYKEFLFLSKKWHDVKTHFLLREFGDQTTAFVHACEVHPELLERNEEYPRIIRAKYVFWDECQDNSDFQHRILRLFYAKDGVPYMNVAIGDPKQQIYVWRGASPRGFLEMIERHRAKHPAKLLGLTCSFRSARAIVALGNEIITTLPSYREKVKPSTTIFEEEGRIEVTKPFLSQEEEAEWVFNRIEHLLERTQSRIMVVSRTDPTDHPLYYRHLRNHPAMDKRISVLTIHQAKGLEADAVFVLGLHAGRLPDPRSNLDEEVNLFYVACTRARHTLILCGLVSKRIVNPAGKVEYQQVGPTPFFAQVPSLRALCLRAGWTKELLNEGVDTNNRALGAHYGRIAKNRSNLKLQRNELFPQVVADGETLGGLTDYGTTEADPRLAGMTKLKLGAEERPGGRTRSHLVSERARERVLKKCIEMYNVAHRLQRLGNDDFYVALKCGWVAKPEGARFFDFTETLVQHWKNAKKAAG
ncbi:MAG: 3'-5' exonuclease [Opitutaceae bacterium]|nr:3'-5' exonuclease [Opitutaceae bacterium]